MFEEDYKLKIIKLFEKFKEDEKISEVIDDYNELLNMMKNHIIDTNKLYSIRLKYDKEIKYISRIREGIFKKIGISTSEENFSDIVSEVDFLINYLPSVMIYRFLNSNIKDNVKNVIENEMYSNDFKVVFRLLNDLMGEYNEM